MLQMRELLRMLASAGESLLLFTQNVVKVSVFHLPSRKHGGGVGGAPSCALDMVEAFRLEKRPIRILRPLVPHPLMDDAEHARIDGGASIPQSSSTVKPFSEDAVGILVMGASGRGKLETSGGSEDIDVLCRECGVLRASSAAMALMRAGVCPEALELPNASLVLTVERRMSPHSELHLEKVESSQLFVLDISVVLNQFLK